MDDNFKFSGFPSNDDIEIPDVEQKQPKHSDMPDFSKMMGMDIGKGLKNMSPELLEALLPDELLDQLESEGVSLEDAAEQIKVIGPQMLGGMLPGMMGMEMMASPEGCNDCDNYTGEAETEEEHSHPLIDTKYLYPDSFGSLLVKETEDLYDEFISRYGTDASKYLDGNVGVKLSALDDITSQLPFSSIKDLKFVESNNRFLLYYAEPNISDLYGFFVGFFKDENDEFFLYVPEFGNTFNIDKDNKVSLYKPAEYPEFFRPDTQTKTAEFEFLSLALLDLAMYYVSAPQKKVLLSPSQFGKIENTMPSIKKPSMFLRIGTIVSNETPEAILLKKDAELDLNETKFPLYVNFGRVVSEGPLQEIAEILFKADLNESLLMKNSELKYTSDHKLYIDIDLGDI